jgi:pimeloyl-ACP methyl ester carboxylesterase
MVSADATSASFHRLSARDGTSIAWRSHGSGAPVILTNGLGSTANFWSSLIGPLARDRSVVHWDYRGHGESDVSNGDGYGMRTLASDLERVTEAAGGGGGAVHIAFSMGVTVLLELYRRRPSLVRAMVLIAGGADHPYATSAAFRVPGARAGIALWLAAAAPFVTRATPFTRRLSESSLLFPIGRALGALNQTAPREELEHFFRSVGSMDMGAYWATLRALLESRASDVLPRITVPVLVVEPQRDVMAPAGDLEQLRTIPGSRSVKIPSTGHAVLLEEGPAVAAVVQGFLEEVATQEAGGA